MYKRGNEEINWTMFLESFTNDTWICIGFTILGLWVFVTCILYFSNKVFTPDPRFDLVNVVVGLFLFTK